MGEMPHPFRQAVEANDLERLAGTLREDVVLHSPILFRGFEGRETVIAVLTHVAATLENLTYVDELHGDRSVCLRFTARVGELELEGVDLLKLDDAGRVADLTVLMRPLSAINAFNERMAARLEAASGS